MAKYTIDFLTQIRKRLQNVNKDFMQDYAVELNGEFNHVPLLEQMRFITEMGNGEESIESKERIAKLSVIGKEIVIFYRGQKIGSATVNDVSNRFDDFEVFRNYPAAYSLLLEVCSRKVVEKYLPPREESGRPVAAVETIQGSQRR